MKGLLSNAISNELALVYGLIALVIILIIVIIIIDKKEAKRKPQNLFDTLNMKIIANPDEIAEINSKEDFQSETIEMNQQKQEINFDDINPLPEVDITESSTIENLEENIYVESDLEKTQAQIRVEEITNALKNAQVEEKIQEDKYSKFEEEQEKNAIISYNELKESFDRLYSENEKIQYLEDDEIPINIEELYQISGQQEEKNKEEPNKVKLDDFSNFKPEKSEPKSNTTFKSSPLISPVYGIQEPPIPPKTTVDTEIENANQFLQSLKELKNNLD